MADELPNVRLNLASTAENVVAVRSVLSGLSEGAGVGAHDLSDIRTAVSEACNNVVQHAYGGLLGPMDVAIELAADAMSVTVRDRGIGIGAHAHADPLDIESMGIGLHVIRTLARDARFDEPPGGGTRVRMKLAARGVRPLQPRLAAGPDLDFAGTMPSFAASVSIAPVRLARGIVPRLATTLAARAHFSTDRLSDVQLLTDAVVAHVPDSVCDQRLSVGIGVRPRGLQLHIAPLRVGQAQGLVRASATDGLGAVIEKLADEHDVLVLDSHETLALNLLDRRG